MGDKKIKILIVSGTPWNDSNSFGSSFSNIFGGNDNYEIANIYCSLGLPDTKVAKRFFQITYKSIVKFFFGRIKSSGRIVYNSPGTPVNADDATLRFSKRKRWQILFWGRDLIWATGAWRSKALDSFIDEFDPDLVFQPVYYEPYINRIGVYAAKRAGVPMVGYTSDDHYSLRQYSISPLYWIDRLIKRQLFRNVVKRCKLLYVITETQRKEYDGYFGEGKCKVLYKGAHFKCAMPKYIENRPLKLLYTGNLGAGRLETLANIASVLSELNKETTKAILEIYSASNLTEDQKKLINITGTSAFNGCVSSNEVLKLQKEADILVHVETFDKRFRYKSRLSLSTKIVDYLYAAKPILSVGWEETGAIEYLMQNNATFAITSSNEYRQKIEQIISDSKLRYELATNAWELGYKNHQIEIIQKSLYDDLVEILDNEDKCNYTNL